MYCYVFNKKKETYSKEEINSYKEEIKRCRKTFSKDLNKRLSDSEVIDFIKGYKVTLKQNKCMY